MCFPHLPWPPAPSLELWLHIFSSQELPYGQLSSRINQPQIGFVTVFSAALNKSKKHPRMPLLQSENPRGTFLRGSREFVPQVEPFAQNKFSKTTKTSFVARQGDRYFYKIPINRGKNFKAPCLFVFDRE